MALSVHDNLLLGYTVDAQAQWITLHTLFNEREPFEWTDVVFEGVAGYHFEQDNFGTILFDVHEISVEKLYEYDQEQFERGQSNNWPGVWNRSREACFAYFSEHNIKGWRISSSYGMHGWVLAEAMTIAGHNTPPVEGVARA